MRPTSPQDTSTYHNSPNNPGGPSTRGNPLKSSSSNPQTSEMVHIESARSLAPVFASIFLLSLLAAMGQFASNVYTPSLPFVAASLGVDIDAAQLTLVTFLLAFGIGQLVYGPLADRFGRRPVLFGGLVLFLAGTLCCALSTSLPALLWARALQAFGVASTNVVARAAARDSFSGSELLRASAMIAIVFTLVPGTAPFVGGFVQALAGWRANFWLTLLLGLLISLYMLVKLPETGHTRLNRIDARAVIRGYLDVISVRRAIFCSLTGGLVFATASTFYAASPALYMEHLEIGPVEYGLYPLLSIAGFIAGSLLVRHLADEVTEDWILVRGLAIMLPALVLMLFFPLVDVVHKHLFNVCIVIHSVGLGMFTPTASALVLSHFPRRAGFAAATHGFIVLTSSAVGVLIVSELQRFLPILALPLVMLSFVGFAIILSRKFIRTGKRGS